MEMNNELNILLEIEGHVFNIIYCDKYIILTDTEQSISPKLQDKINLKLSSIKINTNNNISNDNISNDNTIIINHIKNTIINIIKNEPTELITNNISNDSISNDYMGIFNEKIITKYKLNKNTIYQNYLKNIAIKNAHIPINIPKELLLNDKQFYQMIINEIEKVNSNMNHNHIIVCNNDNIFDLRLRIKYETSNYFELSFILDRLYPFLPPIVEYIKPKIDIILLYNIMTMDIWNLKYWNYTISLDIIITELAKGLEKPLIKYVDKLDQSPHNKMDINICHLIKNTDLNIYDKIPIDINILSITKLQNNIITKNTNNGTGYGSEKSSKWDISNYINIININKNNIINILTNIVNELDAPYNKIESILYKYIIIQFTGITLLDFNKNIELYHIIIKLINQCIKIEKNNDFLEKLLNCTSELYNDINTILQVSPNNSTVQDNVDNIIKIYTFFIEMQVSLQSNIIKNVKVNNIINIIDSTVVDKYKILVASEAYNIFKLTKDYLFNKFNNVTLSKKSKLRILTETASLRKSLPNNWDSSILLRVSNTNINMISFVIIGPKDTPYHNGIFEFHAYFPDNYPTVVPIVLIKTTNGGIVRFNPNLYACGKVCLSLLGTWSGTGGESWIPDVSSFLQILISIQSLILVDNPYFNEPGYENTNNTPAGINASNKYNDNIRLHTIQVAMIMPLKNPLPTYENFIINHFKLKKEEILATVNTWLNESIYHKVLMKQYIDELKELLK